ncbi:hypothetical protein BDN67DRAFT_126719 [Paxillus ammoniavirescens]|nr:hypothetical protein BDN67DRAFT_126719 [Paxillus ammoniavirescens]
MRFFLTLLASIASLSTYTLMGVHAECAVCPPKVEGTSLVTHCLHASGNTHCFYDNFKKFCLYNGDGERYGGQSDCPASVAMTFSGCPTCP